MKCSEGGAMSSQVPIAYADIRLFAHATDDEDKVAQAVRRILPASHIDEVTFERHRLKGHHGNPIVFLEARVKEKEIV